MADLIQGFWLNFDTTGVTMHREGCLRIPRDAGDSKFPRNGKWEAFNTEDEARSATARAVRFAKCCSS